MRKRISVKVLVAVVTIVAVVVVSLIAARRFPGFNSPYPVPAGGGGGGMASELTF